MGSEQGLFNILKGEGFTSLIAKYDWRKDDLQFVMSREWSDKVDWSSKSAKGILKKIETYDSQKVRNLALDYNLDNYLDDVAYLIRTGRHETVHWYYDPTIGIKCLLAVHSKRHKHTIGNIRRMKHGKTVSDMLADTLNLSRTMTYRCAVGKLSSGGARLTVQAPSSKTNGDIIVGFLKYLLKRENILWGVEDGFSDEEMAKLEEVSCVVSDKNTDVEAFHACATAGIYTAIKEAVASRYPKNDKISGKLIGIQGLDTLGQKVGRALLEEGADLIVCDVNPALVDKFRNDNKDYQKNISATSPHDIKMQMGHVFCPCGQAQSGSLTHDAIRGISYNIVVGGAAQLLQAHTEKEEITLADRLLKNNVLYIPDWISNIGAIMYVVEAIEKGKAPELETITKKIIDIGQPALREILQHSKEKEISPLQEAYDKYSTVVYGT